MWFLPAIIGAWLWLNLEMLRSWVGHYPGDALALATWRLMRAVWQALFCWGLLWALVTFSQFVFEGGFFHWLARH